MAQLVLATYLPFNRVHEVRKYFELSVMAAEPDEAWVFVDNVVDELQVQMLQKEISYRTFTGSWGSRVLTWLSILDEAERAGARLLMVDSDNVLDRGIGEIARSWGERLLTFMDWDAWRSGSRGIIPRSMRAGEVEFGGVRRPLYRYRVYDGSLIRSGATFFIGPKQAVLLTRAFERDLVERVRRAVSSLPKGLVKHVSDETLLGILAHASGERTVAWTVGSTHHYRGPEEMDRLQLRLMKAVNALAHERLAEKLYEELGLPEMRRYMYKYRLARIKNALSSVI
jgi:hypothetical protein